MKKVEFILIDTYLSSVQKSIGAEMFQNIYAFVDGEKKDVAENGIYSCANFASSILVMFGLIEKRHATVKSTLLDMKGSGWKKIGEPRIGSVIVWGPWEKSDRDHIGFYVGQDKAISTESKDNGTPQEHHWTYNGKRAVKAVYWHKALEK